jgi:hypothetical protein
MAGQHPNGLLAVAGEPLEDRAAGRIGKGAEKLVRDRGNTIFITIWLLVVNAAALHGLRRRAIYVLAANALPVRLSECESLAQTRRAAASGIRQRPSIGPSERRIRAPKVC